MRRTMLLACSVVVALAAVTGCGTPRDVSTPSKALLGHWRNTIPGTNNDVYFSGDVVTYAQEGGTRPIPVKYRVAGEDAEKFALEIRIGPAEPTKVSFSADRKDMTMLPARIPELLRYEYVDAGQKP